MAELEAGSFERKFSPLLAAELENGRPLTRQLVSDIYDQVVVCLGATATAADQLYIEDMYTALSSHEAVLRQSKDRALIKQIFELIYSH